MLELHKAKFKKWEEEHSGVHEKSDWSVSGPVRNACALLSSSYPADSVATEDLAAIFKLHMASVFHMTKLLL